MAKRLIDADALTAEIEKNLHTYYNEDGGGYYLAEDALDSVKIAPTVDAVEVVRCRECKHYNVFRLECHNGSMNGVIGIDGFCSYGERRKADA